MSNSIKNYLLFYLFYILLVGIECIFSYNYFFIGFITIADIRHEFITNVLISIIPFGLAGIYIIKFHSFPLQGLFSCIILVSVLSFLDFNIFSMKSRMLRDIIEPLRYSINSEQEILNFSHFTNDKKIIDIVNISCSENFVPYLEFRKHYAIKCN